ncbi:MAG: MmgE/PrpD family protein [Acetobacterales bacterium]
MQATKELARWAAEADVMGSDLVRARARDAIYDVIGCIVAGAGDEGSAKVRAAVRGWGEGPATIIGSTRKASAPWAALANGMAAHALDFDDNYVAAFTHASAVLIPALLPLAEEVDASGQKLMEAYIVGLEAQAGVGLGVNRAHYDMGWHGTSTVGCVGAAAACGRLLGLDAKAMTSAISLGVSMASGPKVQFGTMAKPYHAGMAAKNAVVAAGLAAQGLEARDVALEGKLGFFDLYAGDDAAGWDDVMPRLGKPLKAEQYGLSPKRHPCCGSAHKVLDIVIDLRERHGFTADEVAAVEAKVGFGNKRNLMYTEPRQEMEARFSLNYCVAVALLNGRLSLADFTPQAVHRPEVRRLLPLTTMDSFPQGSEGADPNTRKAHDVTIRLKDGRSISETRQWARGTIHDPFDDADYDAKFRDCCEGFLSDDDLAAAQRMLEDIENVASVRDLTKHLVFEAGADHGERFTERYGKIAAQ